ncbi:Crp/Fnr family transcriptional regulator [Aridibaculum aurantiacum]|uniref:Crp/Fnr family transcriptional regulator n=1 Tax=Aridibaculum aurantiacum TaxID=2810307 RepID=UPI001A95EC95|nr:Crp/Fnr family transcriptional regulator [Aridibaculum aurantiacum]
MYELFFSRIAEKIELTEEEKALFITYLTPKKLRRKQYLLQEGDVCKSVAFVEKGALRSYTIDNKGTEHIIQFALEGWWISDMYSMLTGEPSNQNIDAIEDSELVIISRNAQEELMERIPKYERYNRLLLQNAYIAAQRRINYMASLTTEEKYTKLVSTYPDIVQRVPQHMIASYLGLTPETLSRARKQMTRK